MVTRTRPSSDNQYDAIVIGSGIGGLAAASLLAQLAGKRVLVLERHFVLGGFTQTFRRKGFRWDVGLHYVGQMQPGSQLRALFDLVTGGNVQWAALPDRFDHFIYPGLRFDAPTDRAQYAHELTAAFPHQANAIEAYFRDVARAAGWINRLGASKLLPTPLGGLLTFPDRALAVQTTQQYLNRNIADPRLRALLASQWGDYGLPPAQSAFGMHALIVDQYLDGAWYPIGGAGSIVQASEAVIAAAGGVCLVNHPVTELLRASGRVVGVQVAVTHKGETRHIAYRAPLVISDAGAVTTFSRLLPPTLNLPEQRAVAALLPSPSAVTLYLGLKASATTLGISGGNLWMYQGLDHDENAARRSETLTGHPPLGFMSFGSLHEQRVEGHTAQILTWADHSAFARWAGQPWQKRGADYAALKHTIAEGLLDLAERHVPGIREIVSYQELSTPLSVASFTGHAGGAIYGVPATPERLRRGQFGVRTSLPGLLLTGSDVISPGIVGAMMGGVLAAAQVLGPLGYPLIMQASRQQKARVTPAVVG